MDKLSIFNNKNVRLIELNQTKKYDNQKVINKIKIIRLITEKRGENHRKVQNLKLEIFFMMKFIVEKNIYNYLNYALKSSITDYAFNELEMESEAYIILENCIKNFNYKYDFYFYYNKSLGRTFYRMFDKDKRAFDKDVNYRSELHRNSKTTFSENDYELLIFNLGLNKDELLVLKSKLSGQTKKEFFEENPDFSTNKYYNSDKKIKNLLNTLRDKDEL